MVLRRRQFLGETYDIWTGDPVMVAYLAPRHPEEEHFDVIRVGLTLVAETIDFLIVDPKQRGTALPCTPIDGVVGAASDMEQHLLSDEVKRVDLIAAYVG